MAEEKPAGSMRFRKNIAPFQDKLLPSASIEGERHVRVDDSLAEAGREDRTDGTPRATDARHCGTAAARSSRGKRIGKVGRRKDLWNLVAGSGVTENGRTRAACGPTRS